MTRARTYEAAERHGRQAERLAALLLRLKGYRILARHWKSPMGELDIVAARGRTVAFVEVKARAAAAEAAESLGARQRRRIGRAASLFIAAHPALAGHDLRFDLMLVLPWRLPVHIPNAWHEDA
ncbi:MAG TPA: YraN family protein [Stellaceae bacterium]|nr:YraN family protein [Stellaceae bacterium]